MTTMNQLSPDNLKAAERQVYTMKFRDGLHDLQIGLILLVVFGFTLLREWWETWWVLPSYTVLSGAIVGAYFIARNRITRRRIGTMKPVAARKRKIRTGVIVVAFFIAVQVILMVLPMGGVVRLDVERQAAGAIAALIVFVPVAAIAWFQDFVRGYLHAVLIGLSTWSLIATDIGGLFFLSSGLVILAVGSVIFIRFLKDHPLPEEAGDVQA